jgi:hypothetical protein
MYNFYEPIYFYYKITNLQYKIAQQFSKLRFGKKNIILMKLLAALYAAFDKVISLREQRLVKVQLS